MSWQPAPDPETRPAPSCDPVDAVIVPRVRDLGGFEVRRVLPSGARQMVGPFIFLDQMGPVEFPPGRGLDVRPHPHIGLATLTYLFEGTILHRDSLGNVQPIEPREVNWMTAGRGIVHSERSDPEVRKRKQRLFGLQIWVALPRRHEEVAPDFAHFEAAALPTIEAEGTRLRVVAGTLRGATSPVKAYSDLVLADVALQPGTSLALDAEHEERAVQILEGTIQIAGSEFEPGRLLVLRPGSEITVSARSAAHLILLGGEPMDGPRHIWWNFVSSRPERIEEAKRAWKAGHFEPVPGETEFIPLPE